eukprot:COSAG02_NODE_1755_length_11052_cov_67.877842_5_plen_389_part_00
MGKTSAKKRAAGGGAAGKAMPSSSSAAAAAAAAAAASGAGGASQPSREELLAAAANQHEMMNFLEAIALYKAVIEQTPNDVAVIDALGELLLEVGDVDNASQLFKRSIQLSPEANPGKYMYLGQISEGQEAVELFERGIGIMEREYHALLAGSTGGAAGGGRAAATAAATVAGADVGEELAQQRSGLCSAYCSVAEVLLLDAADSEQIHERCRGALTAAQRWDETSPEPHQGLANLHLGRGEAEASLAALEQSVRLTDATAEDPVRRPSFGFRMGNAKLLLELGRWADAVAAFEALMREENEDVELWYMLALSQGLGGDAAAARDCLQQALALLDRHGDDADTSGQLRGQVLAALDELESLPPAAGAAAAPVHSAGADEVDAMEADDL